MKLSKIAFAVAGTLAIASGAAFAGQIGSSSVTIATEVIYADTQIVRAPSNNYVFAGNVDARTNQQLLQLQYTLSKGIWGSVAFPTQLTLNSINVTNTNTTPGTPTAPQPATGPSATAMLKVQYTDGAGVAQTSFPTGSTVNAFVSGDRQTLIFNVTIPANGSPINLLNTPNFTINANNGTNENAGVSGLLTVAGIVACPAPDASADISFKHFTTHNGFAVINTTASPDSEHLRPASANVARLLNFTQNHIFTFTGSSTSRQDASSLNQRLSGQNFTVVAPSGANTGFLSTAFAFAQPGLRHFLGKAVLSQRSQGVDTNYLNIYGDKATGVGLPGDGLFLRAGDFTIGTTATLEDGTVEAATNGGLVITFPAPLPAGANVVAYNPDGSATAAGDFVTTFNAARTQATVTAATANALAGFAAPAGTFPGYTNGIAFFLEFTGTNVIPQLTGITTVATFAKAPAGANREQSVLSCQGNFAGIGGGIKIDVRNYASKAKFPRVGDYASYVRLINNSESNAADVFAQMIYADGTYGPYGQLPSLAPRAVANYSNAALEALMITTPATSNPFSASTVYTQTAGTSVNGTLSGGTTAALGDRVRFVSNTGTTLRVQSYILLPNGNLLDTTNAQGVDFENLDPNRTPLSDGQPISQDAINGLAR